MCWHFLVLIALAFTIYLEKEPLSSHAETVSKASTQITFD